ncbi:ornithine decarboxylase antizyme-domain-containing protein [Apodospora peruviana]|uniref:Ornithine decarboxylase antizyme n=1 Tax=Apodospora peruviana TaxID=516989 RepID=A0AAE0IKZ0_9PEZI|nr:ornithine decarboxylase antizyme-domain-containing protein [Apodospora peruviana]
MAPMNQSSNNHSSNHYGEDVAATHRQANILASCYGPSGIPEVPSTGLPSPPSSPPLAAITSTNELALTPKANKPSAQRSSYFQHGRSGSSSSSSSSDSDSTTRQQHRRRGATLRIREECERFFCEMLYAMFLGERNSVSQRSGLASVYYNNNINNNINDDAMVLDHHHHHRGSGGSEAARAPYAFGQLTPPDDNDCSPIADKSLMASHGIGLGGWGAGVGAGGHAVSNWLEIWDYAGGSSFRAFVAEDTRTGEEGDKSLFVFFDAHVLSRDLKQALVALIELADGPLSCAHMVICIDRSIPGEEAKALTKGLQWAGFSPTTLDFWSGGLDVVSDRWLFMGMEI